MVKGLDYRISLVLLRKMPLTTPARSISAAVLAQLAGALFCAAVSFALIVWLGRQLGAERFGSYVALLNFASLLLIVQEGGWPTLLYREAARERTGLEAQASGSAFAHVLLASALLIVAGLALAFMEVTPFAPLAMTAATVCMGMVALMNVISARMRGAGAFAHEALWQSGGRVMSALAIVLAVLALGESVDVLMLVFLAWAAGLLMVLLSWGRAWLARPRFASLGQRYRQLWPFIMMSGLAVWLVKGDMVVLGGLFAERLTDADLSAYAAATRLSEAGLLLFAPVGNVLLRRFSQLTVQHDPQARRQLAALLRNALLLAFVGGGIAVGGAWLLGDWLMPLLFGAGYATAGALLPWVLAMLPFAMANIVLTQLLTALHGERALAGCMLVAGAALYAGVAWGSAVDGARGAAIGALMAHALLAVLAGGMSVWLLRRQSAPA